jgi:hypothetical protein
MSVTFSGGITFTGGGFSFSAAPPSQPTAGWFAGGTASIGNPWPTTSTVQRITFATDTATASVRGPLSYTNFKGAGTGTLTNGWFGGGYQGGGFASVFTRVTYATDTNTSTNRGAISQVRWGLTATTDGTTYGWFGGGYSYPPPPSREQSTVDRITFANDTATATARGPLATARIYLAATGNTTDGWYAGGQSAGDIPGSQGNLSTVNRITYATDTATATAKGPLSLARYNLAAVSDGTTYGWFGGGYNNGDHTRVDRITYATDTTTASVRGPLTQSIFRSGGSGDSTNGYFGAGLSYQPYGLQSMVQRITYATDTATASFRGTLSVALSWSAASSGVQ